MKWALGGVAVMSFLSISMHVWGMEERAPLSPNSNRDAFQLAMADAHMGQGPYTMGVQYDPVKARTLLEALIQSGTQENKRKAQIMLDRLNRWEQGIFSPLSEQGEASKADQ